MLTRRPVVHSTIAAAAAAALALLSACSSSPSGQTTSGQAKGSYEIGFSDGIGGEIASVAVPELDTVKAVFNAANAAGGVNGHKINLIALNSGDIGSGQAKANVIELATGDHVSAILGMQISNDCDDAAPAAQQYHVPLLCMFSAPSDITPVEQYVYITADIETQEIPAQLKLMSSLLPGNSAPRVSILTNENIGADNWADALQSKLQGLGAQVSLLNTPADATSDAPYVAKIVAYKPDVVFMETNPDWEPDIITALKNAHQDPPMIATLGDADWAAYPTYPKLYGTFIAAPLQPGAPGLTASQTALISQFTKIGMSTSTTINAAPGAMSLAGPEAVLQALKVCGYPCTGQQMASALDRVTNLNVPGVVPAGTFGYSSSDHSGVKKYSYMHWDQSTNSLTVAGTFPAGSPG